jgi:hypothetical protein
MRKNIVQFADPIESFMSILIPLEKCYSKSIYPKFLNYKAKGKSHDISSLFAQRTMP